MDDHMERCEGTTPVAVAGHGALGGIPKEFPQVLGYNKTTAEPEAVMAAVVNDNPLTALGVYEKGENAIAATDCTPHWALPEFCEQEYYNGMWQGVMS